MKEIQETLTALRGCQIRFVRFTASHDRLTLRISKSEEEDLYLLLIFCEEIHLLPLWTLSDPRVRQVGKDGEYMFEDGSQSVRCREIHLQASPPA